MATIRLRRATVIRQVQSDEAGRMIELLRQLWPERQPDPAALGDNTLSLRGMLS